MSLYAQGTIEAEKVIADSLIGDGSRITGLGNQNLAVSVSGDTLHITEGNYVIIPGISASNSGNTFANAGPDIINACETSFNLQASPLQLGTTGEWSVVSGTGGVIINEMLPQALFAGQEGESYLLQWTVQMGGGATSFDQLNISIATNTQTSVANAGSDLFAIMNQSVVLNGNLPDDESRWEILDGTGGILSDQNDPNATFTGVPGESYTLRWIHYNECSTSTDEVTLTFSESAAGVPSANGRYFIPDPKFRQYLQIAYPSVMDGDSLIVSEASIVTRLFMNNLTVNSLDGLQYITNLKTLVVTGGLSTISVLAPGINRFECNGCHNLLIIPDFPLSLDTIRGDGWKIETIPDFPLGLKYLKLRELYRLEHFPSIPDSCIKVDLDELGDPQFYPRELDATFNIPAQCEEFRVQGIALDEFPIVPTEKENLQMLDIHSTKITSMPSLYDFTNLTHIGLSTNELLVLDSLPFATQWLNVSDNPIICVKNKPPLVAAQLTEFQICPE